MNILNKHVQHSVQGGQTTVVLTAQEACTVYFVSAAASNFMMSAIGISPVHSFPISLFSSLIPVYFYGEAKKNPA